MKQALKQQGFTGVGQKQTEWKAWMEREIGYFIVLVSMLLQPMNELLE
jgi:hypothetical protein